MTAHPIDLIVVDGQHVPKPAFRNEIKQYLREFGTESAVQNYELAGTAIIVVSGTNYVYDPTDTTTVHDGRDVLVSQDGRRYKARGTRLTLDMFGVPVGDTGTIDRGPAITLALTFAAGRPVYAQKGRFLIATPVVIDFRNFGRIANEYWYPGPKLIGESRDSTIFITSCTNSPAFKFWNGGVASTPGTQAKGVELRNFRLEASASATDRDGIVVECVKHSEISHLTLRFLYTGIRVVAVHDGDGDGSSNLIISNNSVLNSGNIGIDIACTDAADNSTSYIDILHNIVQTAPICLKITGLDQGLIANNQFVTASQYNVFFDWSGQFHNANVLFTRNEIGNNLVAAIAHININSMENGHFLRNRFILNTTEGSTPSGYKINNSVIGPNTGPLSSIKFEEDTWLIAKSFAFTAYDTDSAVPDGVGQIINPNYYLWNSTVDPIYLPEKWGKNWITYSIGTGTTAIDLTRGDYFHITVTATGAIIDVAGTPLAGKSSSNKLVTIALLNSTGVTTTIQFNTGRFSATNLASPTGAVSRAVFARSNVEGKWVQLTPWNKSTGLDGTFGDITISGNGTSYAVNGLRSGTGSPEGVVTATVGTLYRRTDGGAGTTLYVKESGTGNTGWVAK
jgi:hypothetical protein